MEKEEINLEDFKICVNWLFKANKPHDYRYGYMEALYDMAAKLGLDEELSDYHNLMENN